MRRRSDLPSRSVQTAAPDDVRDGKVLQVRLFEVNAHKIQCNGQEHEHRVRNFVVARVYREPLPRHLPPRIPAALQERGGDL